MTSAHKTMLIVLLALLGGAALLLAREIQQARNIVVTPTTQALVAPNAVYIPTYPNERILGNPGAPLTLTLFMDLSCASCQKLFGLAQNFILSHPKDARLIWKDAPKQGLLLKPATAAHLGAYCAGAQNAFWPFVNRVLSDQIYYNEKKLRLIAQDLHLNLTAWDACLTSPEAIEFIATGLAIAQQLQLGDAPILFINNKQVNLNEEFNLTDLLASFSAP